MFIDYYSALGVSKTASEKEIKEAYRQLAKQCHPDMNAGPEAHKQFLLISEAYKILSDREKRDLYNYRHLAHERKSEKPKAKSSIEITREKRKSRYKRGYYEKRTSYKRPHRSAYVREESETAQRQKSYEAAKEIGYTWLARFTKALAALSLILCTFLLVDNLFATDSDGEKIIHLSPRAYSFFSPGVYNVQTSNYKFELHKSYARRLFEGDNIKLIVTPWGKYVTKMYFPSRYGEILIKPWGGLYGGMFFLVILLIFSSGITFYPGLNKELLGYIGILNVLLMIALVRALL